MRQLVESYKKSGDLHHAYFLIGNAEEIFQNLKDFLEEEVGFKTAGSADFWHGKYNTLNIENARLIAESQGRKDFVLGKKIFVIETDFITEEAQNALLKVFEEPTVGTHFFIISPQEVLLPTLRSRLVVELCESESNKKTKSVLNMELWERLEMVKEITEAISDEEKTKQDAITFLNQIEKELYKQGLEKNHKSLAVCEQARASLYDRGAPVKMILENLVLSI